MRGDEGRLIVGELLDAVFRIVGRLGGRTPAVIQGKAVKAVAEIIDQVCIERRIALGPVDEHDGRRVGIALFVIEEAQTVDLVEGHDFAFVR